MKILLVLLFMPLTAIAADWVLITATQNIEIEIDKQSVRPGKGAWFRFIYTPAVIDGCAGSGKKKSSTTNYVEANCKEFTYRTKKSLAYSEDGSLLEYCGHDDPKMAFTEYAPETAGEVFFRAICDPNGRLESEFAVRIREGKLGNKLLFAECKNSSECAGDLLCKVVAGSAYMQCLFP